MEIQGKFIKFTAIGVYLEDKAIPLLAGKWKGKAAEELTESIEFFRDVVSGNGVLLFLSPITEFWVPKQCRMVVCNLHTLVLIVSDCCLRTSIESPKNGHHTGLMSSELITYRALVIVSLYIYMNFVIPSGRGLSDIGITG